MLLGDAWNLVVETPSLGTMALIGAACCILYALAPSPTDVPKEKRTAYLVGAGLLIIALVLGAFNVGSDIDPNPIPAPTPAPIPMPDPDNPTPTPYPGPTPNPEPHPPTPAPDRPLNSFQQQVIASWNGTREEALVFAGMFVDAADGITFDGTRATPKIQTSNNAGDVFNDMQRYVGLSETPWAGRFPETKNVIVNQMEAIGIVPKPGEMLPIQYTPAVRAAAANLYREVGVALSQVGL